MNFPSYAFQIHFQIHYPLICTMFFECATIQIFSSTSSGNKLPSYPQRQDISSTCFLPTCDTDCLSVLLLHILVNSWVSSLFTAFMVTYSSHMLPNEYSFSNTRLVWTTVGDEPVLVSSYNSKFNSVYMCQGNFS